MAINQAPAKRGFPWKWLVIGLICGAAVYWIFFHHAAPKAGANPNAQGIPASVSTVITQNVTPWSDFSGRLEATSAAEVRPRVSGEIVGIHFRDGEEVKKGQPLFTIDPRPYEAELARTKGQLVAAESASANAELNYNRAGKLIKSKAISQNEFDLRASNLRQAQGQLVAAQGAAAAAALNVEYAHIVAPISGRISRAEILVGNQVEAGGNAPLLASVVTVSPIYASFELDEQTFLHTIAGVPSAKLRNIPVEVGLSSDTGTPIQATIHSFDNQITAGSGTIRVRALIPNKDGKLVPGLYARIRIGTPEQVEALLINPAAVGTDQNKKYVLVVGEGSKAEYREVTLGGQIDGLQMVTSGLKGGESIVVSGLQRLRPGAPVQPQPVDMKTLKGADAPAADAKPTDAAAAAEAKPEEAKPTQSKTDDTKPADAKSQEAK